MDFGAAMTAEPKFSAYEILLGAARRAIVSMAHVAEAWPEYRDDYAAFDSGLRQAEARAALESRQAPVPQSEPGQWEKIETLVRQIHEATKRGERTQDHGLIGNLRCILDHVLPNPPPFDEAAVPQSEALTATDAECEKEALNMVLADVNVCIAECGGDFDLKELSTETVELLGEVEARRRRSLSQPATPQSAEPSLSSRLISSGPNAGRVKPEFVRVAPQSAETPSERVYQHFREKIDALQAEVQRYQRAEIAARTAQAPSWTPSGICSWCGIRKPD
jgi:hypothetical protein